MTQRRQLPLKVSCEPYARSNIVFRNISPRSDYLRMDELIKRADLAIEDSRLLRRQVYECTVQARLWNARLLSTVSRSREEIARSHQYRAQSVQVPMGHPPPQSETADKAVAYQENPATKEA